MSSQISVLAGDLEKLLTDLTTLTPHPKNARRSDKEAIARSMIKNGVYKPVIYQAATRHVLVGNHTRAAALDEGVTMFPAIAVDVDDTTALRIMAADNRIADQGAYDTSALADLLREISDDGDLEGTGYDDTDLEDLLSQLEDDEEVLPPGPTEAAWAETPEELGERTERVSGGETLAARGLSEMIVLLGVDDKADLIRDIAGLREHVGADMATGAVLQVAVRVALAVYDAADASEGNTTTVMDLGGIIERAARPAFIGEPS